MKQAKRDQTWVVWLSLGQLISWGGVFYLFGLIMPPVEQALGMSRAESSLAFSLALLVEGLLAFPVGRWIDKGHERVVMCVGSLLLATGLGLHSLVQTPLQFYAVWALLGVGMSCTLYTPAFAVVTRHFPLHFRRAIITMTFLGGLASTVFIPLTAWLMNHLGWREALWVLAALHLGICLPIHVRLLINAPKPLFSIDRHSPPSATKAGASVGQLLLSPTFAFLAVFMILIMAVTAALPAHLISLLREKGLSETWSVAIPASIGLLQVLGRLLLYFFEHHFDLHTTNRVVPCLIPLGIVCLLVAPLLEGWSTNAALVLLCLFMLLWGMGVGMITIVKGTAIAQYVSQQHVAALNGALGLPLALARASAPMALGLLWFAPVGYTYGLLLLLVLSVLAVVALVLAQQQAK